MARFALTTDGGPNATIEAASRAEAVTAALALMTREGFADGDVAADDAGWCDGEIRFARNGRADGYSCASLVAVDAR